MDDNKKVIEGEITTQPSSGSPNDRETLTTIVGLIQNYLGAIEREKKELTENKQMLEDALNNDPVYKEHADKAKEAVKIKSATKLQILRQPQLSQVVAKVKELSEQLKEKKESLSQYLLEYARISGERQIEGPDGQIQEIVYQARLVRGVKK